MLNVAVGSIKALHDVKVQCDLDGSTHDEHLSQIVKAASKYDSTTVQLAGAESVQCISTLSESVEAVAAMEPPSES